MIKIRPQRCGNCNQLLDQQSCLPRAERAPCPYCGLTARAHSIEIDITLEPLAYLNAEGRRKGMSRGKGWFKRIRTALVIQRNRGDAIADYERVMDRDSDRYTETVTMRDTGEAIHHCDEPLSKHQGHGCAHKPKSLDP